MFTRLSTFANLVQDTHPFNCLFNPDHQCAIFLIIMAACLAWYIVLAYSSHRSVTRELDDPSTTDPTKIMEKLAPLGHCPTNAQLGTSPFHLACGLASPTRRSISEHPLAASDILTNGKPTVTLPPQGRNFSGLAKAAPVSYETLRQRGMLDKNGSPTSKYAREKRLEELMGGR